MAKSLEASVSKPQEIRKTSKSLSTPSGDRDLFSHFHKDQKQATQSSDHPHNSSLESIDSHGIVESPDNLDFRRIGVPLDHYINNPHNIRDIPNDNTKIKIPNVKKDIIVDIDIDDTDNIHDNPPRPTTDISKSSDNKKIKGNDSGYYEFDTSSYENRVGSTAEVKPNKKMISDIYSKLATEINKKGEEAYPHSLDVTQNFDKLFEIEVPIDIIDTPDHPHKIHDVPNIPNDTEITDIPDDSDDIDINDIKIPNISDIIDDSDDIDINDIKIPNISDIIDDIDITDINDIKIPNISDIIDDIDIPDINDINDDNPRRPPPATEIQLGGINSEAVKPFWDIKSIESSAYTESIRNSGSSSNERLERIKTFGLSSDGRLESISNASEAADDKRNLFSRHPNHQTQGGPVAGQIVRAKL